MVRIELAGYQSVIVESVNLVPLQRDQQPIGFAVRSKALNRDRLQRLI